MSCWPLWELGAPCPATSFSPFPCLSPEHSRATFRGYKQNPGLSPGEPRPDEGPTGTNPTLPGQQKGQGMADVP